MGAKVMIRLAACFLAACSGDAASTGRMPGGNFAAAGAGGLGAPLASQCPASNLTQQCVCDNGLSGRQICIETTGWGACDCGQASQAEQAGSGGLHTPNVTPPANMDTAIVFTDYVMPKMLNPGDCMPGNYVGTFQCFYEGPLSPDPLEVIGVVSFALDRSANSEVLEIKDGLLDGWGIMFFFAYLNGELNCANGELSGSATEGFYNPILKGCSGADGDQPGTNCIISDKSDPGYMPWAVTLEGSYAGSLDPSTDTISGSWSLVPDLGGSCDGTFTVTLMP